MKGGRRKHPDLMVLEGSRIGKKSNPARPEPMTPKSWKGTPRWLPKYAKEFVNRYRKPLERANVLTSWDFDSFLTMALLAAEIKSHVQTLEKDGYTVPGRQGGIVKHPQAPMLKAAQQQFRLYAADFGLNPRGRSGLDISVKDDDDDWDGVTPRMQDLID